MPLHDKAFYIALSFVLGIGAAGFNSGVWWALIGAFLLAKYGFSLRMRAALLFTLGIFLGFFYFNLYADSNQANVPLGIEGEYSALITAEPEEGLTVTEIQAELEPPHQGTVYIYTAPGVRYQYGDVVAWTGTITPSTSGKRNIVSFPDDMKIVDSGRGNVVRGALIGFKGQLVDNLGKALPAEHAALASGLLLGERAGFTDQFEEAMRRSGTTHIVALSGYNIAILVVVLGGAFAYLWGRRKAFYISLAVIPAFVIMTGGDPSVVRAGIMGLILLLAEHQGRSYSFRNALVFTAAAMLLFDPTLLSSNVAFQLSFAALLGIVYLYPWLTEKLRIQEEGFLSWKKNVLQTASAQIAVLPVILGTFGYFAPTSLISNVLILEFIPVTMLLSFLTAAVGFLSVYLSVILGWVTSIFLGYEVFIIKLFGLTWA